MKEAAGEANMTVITIVLIAIVLGVGTLIVTNIMENAENSVYDSEQACTEAGRNWNSDTGKCTAS